MSGIEGIASRAAKWAFLRYLYGKRRLMACQNAGPCFQYVTGFHSHLIPTQFDAIRGHGPQMADKVPFRENLAVSSTEQRGRYFAQRSWKIGWARSWIYDDRSLPGITECHRTVDLLAPQGRPVDLAFIVL